MSDEMIRNAFSTGLVMALVALYRWSQPKPSKDELERESKFVDACRELGRRTGRRLRR